MYQRILVAVDGSSTSDAAMREGIRFAREHGAQLRLVHILDAAPIVWGTEGYADISAILDSIRRTGERILDQSARLAEQAGVAVEKVLLESTGERIPNMIIAAAKSWPADLVVIGTHGRRGFDHMLMGSVAEGVIRIAPVPVLLVRAA